MSMKWAMQSDAAKYMTGSVTSYDAGTGDLVLNVTSTAGSGTSAAWEGVVTAAAASNKVTRRAISSADTVGAGDIAKLIDITSGTFTLAFDACATLGNGAWGYIRNAGTGDVTLDPNSSEQIDGLTSFVMYPGAVRLWQCDGSAIRTVPLVGGTKTFSSTASYVWAPGIQMWSADLTAGGAGGGGGARAASRYNGGGGGAGERWRTIISLAEVTAGVSVTCTVGAKGIGGAAATGDNLPAGPVPTNGTAGGTSSIGALRSVAGGTSAGSGAYTSSHGQGPLGGGKAAAPAGNASGQYNSSGAGVATLTEWGGPNGRAGGDSTSTRIQALLGGQSGGRGGAYVAAGATGANGANPGDGGDGGGGNLNGSAAGAGGDGVDGRITIVEVI